MEPESWGRNLNVAEQEGLMRLAKNSEGILKKIQVMQDKHKDLRNRSSLGDQLQESLESFVEDIRPQRQAIRETTHALAAFNATFYIIPPSWERDCSQKQRRLRKVHFAGSGKWLFQMGSFLSWLNSQSSATLCCYGPRKPTHVKRLSKEYLNC